MTNSLYQGTELPSWPQSDLESIPHCPVCGAEDRILMYAALRDRIFHSASGEWSLYQCRSCLSGYLDPRPTSESIHKAYRTYFTHTSNGKISHEKLGPIEKLIRSLANGYRNQWKKDAYLPAYAAGKWLVQLAPLIREQLDRELRFLDKNEFGQKKVLDIGFGGGEFLEIAHKAGWQVSGSDPDPVAVRNAHARGFNVRLGGAEVWSDSIGKFDTITLSHVIEHVHDPGTTLRTVAGLLKPGGSLFIETPNIDALGHRKYGPDWRGLEPPRHLVLFCWRSLEQLLLESGFERVVPKPLHMTYAAMSAASHAAQQGLSPESNTSEQDIPRMLSALAKILWTYCDYRVCEFITYRAFKK